MVNTNITDQSNKITSFGYSSFLVTIMASTFFGTSSYIIFSISNIDSYISAIAGTIFGIIPLLVFLFIIKHSDNMDILDLNVSLFRKPIGITINSILSITILFISIVLLYNMSQFIDIQFMPDTDTNYLRILMLIPIIYASSKNIKVISKISQIFAIINISMFAITVLGLIANIDTSAILPVMKNGIKDPALSSIIYTVFTTFPIFLLTIIPQSEVVQDKNNTKKIFLFYFIANLILIIFTLLTITLLCEKILPLYRYPDYIILKRFEMFSIIERVENILALQFVFCNIMYQILSFHFIIKSIKKIFKKNQSENLFPILIGIIVLIASNLIFKNTINAASFFKKILVYIILVGFFIPIILTYIALTIRTFKSWISSIKKPS